MADIRTRYSIARVRAYWGVGLVSALNKHLAAACLVKAATEHATAATDILS